MCIRDRLGDDGLFYGAVFVAVFNILVWTYGLVCMSGDIKESSAKKLITNPGIIGVVTVSYTHLLVYKDGKIYFHCAKNGHKLDAIKQNKKVSFCVIEKDEVDRCV